MDPSAYESFQLGRFHWEKRTAAGFQKGIEYYEDAIRKDPTFAPAHAELAVAYATLGAHWLMPCDEAFAMAKASAMRALELDPELGAAHATLGYAKAFGDWDWSGFEASYQRGFELSDGDALAHMWYAMISALMGDTEKAITESERARILDPMSPLTSFFLCLSYYLDDQHDSALPHCEKAVELNPSFALAQGMQSMIYKDQGMLEDALAAAQQAVSSGRTGQTLGALGMIYGVLGEIDKALGVLEELDQMSSQGYVAPDARAMVYVGLGDTDRAIQWLETANDERTCGQISLKTAPWYDALRSDSRYQDLQQRINFPQ